MTILIDNKSGTPIYDQIYTQIRAQILDGTICEDEMLPSIRNLAKDLRISVITTKRAYEELERAGYIYTVAGKGSYAAPKNTELVREQTLRRIEALLGEAQQLAAGMGLTQQQLVEMLITLCKEV